MKQIYNILFLPKFNKLKIIENSSNEDLTIFFSPIQRIFEDSRSVIMEDPDSGQDFTADMVLSRKGQDTDVFRNDGSDANLQDENDFANETIIHLNNEIYDKQQEIYRLKNLQKKKKKDITNRIPFIELEFGEGLIRYYENRVYYHGIGSNEKQKWNKDNKWDKSILLFPENRRIIRPYTTHNIDEYCNNCILDEQLSNEPGPSRNKTKYQVFKCLGHEY